MGRRPDRGGARCGGVRQELTPDLPARGVEAPSDYRERWTASLDDLGRHLDEMPDEPGR